MLTLKHELIIHSIARLVARSQMACGLPLVALLQALVLALSWTSHGGALVRHSRARAAPLRSRRELYDAILSPTGDPFVATGDGANILPAAAIEHPVLGRVARAAVAAIADPIVDGEDVGSTWVREKLREEFRASVRGLRFDHTPGDGRFEALWAAAGSSAEGADGCEGGARLARICGGRHWDLLIYLFPASASPQGAAWVGAQPESTIQLLKPLVGEWERAIYSRASGRRAQVRQIRAGEGGDLGGATKLHGGPVREFSGAGGAPCALFEVMLKRPVTNSPPPSLPLLELTPELASAFYDEGGAAASAVQAQSHRYAGNAPVPISAADGSLWEPQYHEEHGEYYYINSLTGEASWQPAEAAESQRDQYAGNAPAPISAPDGSTWEPQYHEEQGEYYYINSATGEASWEPAAAAEPQRDQYASNAPAPISAPDGSTWEPQYHEETGEYFFVNSATGEASWLDS